MSSNLSAAHIKNLKPISPNQKHQPPSQIHPTNKPYLESGYPKQSQVRQFNREAMIEQNQKLKKHVIELAEHMQEVLQQGRQKKKYGLHLEETLDAQTEEQKNQIKQQEFRINELKNQLFAIKKENQYVWDESAVVEKENGIKAIQAQIRPFEQNMTGLMKVRKEQEKALNSLKNDEQYNSKIQKTRSQLLRIKEETKVLAAKTQENEKLLLKAHQKTVKKSKRVKYIQQKIRQNKQKIKKGTQNVVTVEMISQIEQQIMNLEAQYKEIQKTWTERINNLQIEHNNRKIQEEKKLMILREKEREVKLNDIRLKQFRKLIVQSKIESSRAVEEAGDSLKEFRHKRNIKYLQKS